MKRKKKGTAIKETRAIPETWVFGMITLLGI